MPGWDSTGSSSTTSTCTSFLEVLWRLERVLAIDSCLPVYYSRLTASVGAAIVLEQTTNCIRDQTSRLDLLLAMAFLKHMHSVADFDTLLNNRASGLVVVDFHATWCRPCHAIAPVFDKLSQSYRHVAFAKVDVDAQPAISRRYEVSAMPTFLFIKNKYVVDTVCVMVSCSRHGRIQPFDRVCL